MVGPPEAEEIVDTIGSNGELLLAVFHDACNVWAMVSNFSVNAASRRSPKALKSISVEEVGGAEGSTGGCSAG